MSRRKQLQNISENADFIGISTDSELDSSVEAVEKPPIATEEHQIVTTFVRKRPVETPTISSDNQKNDPLHLVVTPLPESSEPGDEIEAFLREVSQSNAQWEMLVYRLPRYDLDNRTDPLSRKRVGSLPFTWEYEAEIQKRWARPSDSNHFLIVMRKNGQHVKNGTLPVFSCEPLPVDERIPSGAEQQVPQQIVVPVAAPYPAITEHQPPPSPKEQLKEALELVRMVQGITGTSVANPAAVAPLDPEAAVFQLLAKDEHAVSKLSKGLLGKFFGDVKEDRDPWAEVAMEAVRNGQAAELLKVGINSLFQGFSGFLPQPPQQQQQSPQQSQPQPPPKDWPPQALPTQTLAPSEELLSYVLQQCHLNAPREAVADQIITFADQINETDPLQSVDWYIRAFALMPTDEALVFVNQSVPGSERITELPHAKAWTAELQQLLKQNYEVEAEGTNDDQHQPDLENVG